MPRLRLPLFLLVTPSPAVELPRCTIAVAGANGRVGSMVCRELLRAHTAVTVRALVRTASDVSGFERLSYEVGAEDGAMELRPAWRLDEQTGRLAAPATVQFDDEVQRGFGLARLELRECELRAAREVEEALADVDGVIFCATSFDTARRRLPDRVDEAAGRLASAGMALFELRLGDAIFGKAPRAGGADAPAASELRGKTADVEGLQNVLSALARNRKRRASLAELSGQMGRPTALRVPFVLASACDYLGYDEDLLSRELRETEFGYRKRMGDAAVRASSLPYTIVHSARIDGFAEEGLKPQVERREDGVASAAEAQGAVGVRRDDARGRRIHPRDLAAFLVSSLATSSNTPEDEQLDSQTVEVWTLPAM
ncbi:hypothetical protein AB1Y20_009793 [Prymnesium parvum]|uniref:NAD(P)-binding domain-containing protein n=1 Tax=Prymnesium parvum TaxID=97485 RepID=A0AB34K5F9_PRYPA